jgi:hypothetical protein
MAGLTLYRRELNRRADHTIDKVVMASVLTADIAFEIIQRNV